MRIFITICLLLCAPFAAAEYRGIEPLIEVKTDKGIVRRVMTDAEYMRTLIALGNKGDVFACKELVNVYTYGLRGVAKSKNRALMWMVAAGNLGDKDAIYFVAKYSESQIPKSRNYDMPITWYGKVAAQKYSQAETDAALAKIKELTKAKEKYIKQLNGEEEAPADAAPAGEAQDSAPAAQDKQPQATKPAKKEEPKDQNFMLIDGN